MGTRHASILSLINDVATVATFSAITLALLELNLPGMVSSVIDLTVIIFAAGGALIVAALFPADHVRSRWKKMYGAAFLTLDAILFVVYIALQYGNYLVALAVSFIFFALVSWVMFDRYDRRRNG